ncbi:nitrite reductase (NADH) small subunit [Streptosporangium becharense]|uniref:Nitrite reductase (NADH) small subunit n=1 Tax=Streptosporangium becharense TaxID=1816182 RepID=A0A7W9IBT8_9ACTN|nr:nitrite reductase small subunit NirD [Streptosporangium becharense]MBB2913779.1 nitrite reductase (NADH) small subunit [Streptosporangium becharense]MBB5817860.1 nitrite reductase (NADH) small subunit [Streptosporangium becharense]
MTALREDLETTCWTPVCSYTDLLPERGACALVDGRQVALFRTFDGVLYAIGNHDPFSGAQVLSRGIVGTRTGEPCVASPMHKQVFSLVTGVCLDDPAVSVPTYPVRVAADGAVEVGAG